jgi:aspartyl-tRNA synthetase
LPCSDDDVAYTLAYIFDSNLNKMAAVSFNFIIKHGRRCSGGAMRCPHLHSRHFSAGAGDGIIIHRCGTLRTSHVDNRVKLKGWVQSPRNFGGQLFVGLRDGSGITQLVWSEEVNRTEDLEIAGSLRDDHVVEVEGRVKLRPGTLANAQMATGDVEVWVESVRVLNPSAKPPLDWWDPVSGAEGEGRLRYRYLCLRSTSLQRNLRVRQAVTMAARLALTGEGFLEVETPTLFVSTPEGAREFLVPSRQEGKFYALPQSPQQYKQLLMVGGIEKYFQVTCGCCWLCLLAATAAAHTAAVVVAVAVAVSTGVGL